MLLACESDTEDDSAYARWDRPVVRDAVSNSGEGTRTRRSLTRDSTIAVTMMYLPDTFDISRPGTCKRTVSMRHIALGSRELTKLRMNPEMIIGRKYRAVVTADFSITNCMMRLT